MQLSCKFQGIEPPKGLCVPNEQNKVLVLVGLKPFSKIGELEAKLYQMLESHGPEILYKGAIDGAVLHVNTLTEHIEKVKVDCNIGATQAALNLQEDVKKGSGYNMSQPINNEDHRYHLKLTRKLQKKFFLWTNTLTDSMNDKMLSLKLHEQSMEMLLLKDLKNIKNVKGCRDGMPKSIQTR